LSIASDGTVTIVAHRSEMGCGSRTALAARGRATNWTADWSKVKIDQATGDPKYGDQDYGRIPLGFAVPST